MNRSRWAPTPFRSWAAALVCLFLLGCTDFGGTDVRMTFNAGVLASLEGEHYELFVTVNGSAVSLKRFIVRNEPVREGLAVKSIVDFDPPNADLGVSDSLDANGLLQGGIRFRVPLDLSGATNIFATVELNGESDPAPSREVVFVGTLAGVTRGTLGAVLLDPSTTQVTQTNNELGTATLVLPDDGANGF